MKLGCCVNMFATPEDPAGLQWLGLVKRSGCDYVELPLAQVMELDEPAFRALCVKIWELELPCRCCNNFFPASVRLTGPQVDWKRAENYAAMKLYNLHDWFMKRYGEKQKVFWRVGMRSSASGRSARTERRTSFMPSRAVDAMRSICFFAISGEISSICRHASAPAVMPVSAWPSVS